MKIESGKYYRTRDGSKVGPMSSVDCPKDVLEAAFEGEYLRWFSDGLYRVSGNHHLDIIAEWTDEPDTPKTKRETVTLGAHFYGTPSRWVEGDIDPDFDTHRITFDVVGGKPDCSSVRMEEVGQWNLDEWGLGQ